jgi:hypothetical protein
VRGEGGEDEECGFRVVHQVVWYVASHFLDFLFYSGWRMVVLRTAWIKWFPPIWDVGEGANGQLIVFSRKRGLRLAGINDKMKTLTLGE